MLWEYQRETVWLFSLFFHSPLAYTNNWLLHSYSNASPFLQQYLIMVYTLCAREGNGTPLQYSCLGNPMDGGAWKAAVHRVTEGWTRLSHFTFTFHFHALEKEMVTHSSVLAWRIPGTAEPGGLPSMGSHRVGHDWSDSTAVAAYPLCSYGGGKIYQGEKLGKTRFLANFLGINSFTSHFQAVKVGKT